MKNNDTQNEIELLRKQLEEMQKKRITQQSDEQEAPKQPETGVEDNANLDTAMDNTEDLISQFKDLIESIDSDIRDTKPTTLLAVFALGVLVGRL